MEKDQFIGRLLDGRYEILETIGSGGMAVVYKAKCHRLNRMVAIKILKEEFAQDEEFRHHFRAESQAVAMLSHPNIVSIYDVSSSSTEYIVTELIDGITLKQYMEKKGVLNWKETLHFATQIAKALEHAHAKGIVHRDIKPHNVMVLKSGAIKVMDFGIAQTLTGENAKTTEALGSVHYISPEQAKGARIDNRSDIYSLGVVMYEMITGRVPFDGELPVDVAVQHITGGANPPSSVNAATPEGLEQIIVKAMALLPKNRYATATEMLYDLDAFRKEHTKAAPVLLPMENAGVEQTTVAQRQEARRNAGGTPAPRPQPVDDEDNRPNRVAIIAIISCVLVGIIAATVVIVLGIQSGWFEPPEMVSVPRLVGQKIDGLKVDGLIINELNKAYSDKYPAGTIIAQSPEAGTKVEPNTLVHVTVSLGAASAKMEIMPDVVGETQNEAKRILNQLGFNNIKIEKQWSEDPEQPKDEVIIQSEEAWKKIDVTTQIVLTVSKGPHVEMMPDVVGETLDEAKRILNKLGFKDIEEAHEYNAAEAGTVIGQSHEPNSAPNVNDKIILTVSDGPHFEMMPDLTGMTPEEAKALLESLGFTDVVIEEKYLDDLVPPENPEDPENPENPENPEQPTLPDVPMGTIILQSVEANTEVDVTAQIILTVSKGPYMKEIPDGLVGLTLEEARALLTELGFENITEEYVFDSAAENTIIEQPFEAGTLVASDEQIVLKVSKGPYVEMMPNLMGKTFEEAKAALEALGFKDIEEAHEYNAAEAGTVIGQSVDAFEQIDVTTEIVLTVSDGPEPVEPEQPEDPAV